MSASDSESIVFRQALVYLSRGWSVIPLLPKQKIPACKWGVFRYRHMTPGEVELNFADRKRERNIGIVTGKISGLFVVDFDDEEKGLEFLERFDTFTVKTGKGFHFYFAYPKDMTVPSRNNVEPFMDFRGENGYVVAPPSIHPNGSKYEIFRNSEIAPFPYDFAMPYL